MSRGPRCLQWNVMACVMYGDKESVTRNVTLQAVAGSGCGEGAVSCRCVGGRTAMHACMKLIKMWLMEAMLPAGTVEWCHVALCRLASAARADDVIGPATTPQDGLLRVACSPARSTTSQTRVSLEPLVSVLKRCSVLARARAWACGVCECVRALCIIGAGVAERVQIYAGQACAGVGPCCKPLDVLKRLDVVQAATYASACQRQK